jgi:RNA recognition motif-containing protein
MPVPAPFRLILYWKHVAVSGSSCIGQDSLFEVHGSVDRVSIVTDRDSGQPRGFGFVEMTNDADGDRAISAINGQDVGGRALNVNEAKPKSEGGGRGFGGGGRGNSGGGGRGRY